MSGLLGLSWAKRTGVRRAYSGYVSSGRPVLCQTRDLNGRDMIKYFLVGSQSVESAGGHKAEDKAADQ